ncbi:NUDIX domain-containing protein [Paenactinomyces guangxiensis]|uniref:NUDIX domain-containing protein n=1 Tax=Paenactinomyces guangxiensis TaxID=1490290 RepID=A0A7W1WRK8_9BACL|nr:NUDIX domain-containing protein [Paenactinomyces guangxiensis]MBA4494772.1 NUDIX domain-containing protein [Paenactinomyces guangxiensis]MBH8591856.1 NUDIX domain-containing protein [Paenactinomyces guangxiensis]
MGYRQGIRNWIGRPPHLLVGAHVLIINDKDRLLLQQCEQGSWGLPGGLLLRGETLEDTARRTVCEQTGLVVDRLRLVRIFSGEKYRSAIADKKWIVAAVYATDDIKGDTETNERQQQFSFFDLTKLPENMDVRFLESIKAYVTARAKERECLISGK